MPAAGGASRCAECTAKLASERQRDHAREYRTRRQHEDECSERESRFYRSKEWRDDARAYAVSVGHRCEECGAVGTDTHHVVPIQTDEGWARRLDWSNYRYLCVPCHNKAHGRFGFRPDPRGGSKSFWPSGATGAGEDSAQKAP